MYYNNLGFALTMEGRLTEALSACEQAIRFGPNMPEAYCNYGNVLNGLGRLEKALAAYDQAIRLNPAYADAHFNAQMPYWQLAAPGMPRAVIAASWN